jgi:transcriptional regulator with XRE-family HTH domain
MIAIELEALGERLKEERERLELSQERCSQLAGITRMSQSRYETGVTLPGLEYLARLGNLKFDTTYVMFGRRSATCVFIDNPQVYSQAIDFVDELAAQHGFEPPPDFRVRAILRTYQHLTGAGSRRRRLTLQDLLTGEASKQP